MALQGPRSWSLRTSIPGTAVGRGAEPVGELLRVWQLRFELSAGGLLAWAAEGLEQSCHQLSTGKTAEVREKGLGVERRIFKNPW